MIAGPNNIFIGGYLCYIPPGVTYGKDGISGANGSHGTMVGGCTATAGAVVGAAAPDEVGKAAGANSMLRELGGVFGIAILVAVFAGAGSYASAEAFSDGFAPAIAVAAALSLAGAIAGLGLPGRPRSTGAALRPLPTVQTAGAR